MAWYIVNSFSITMLPQGGEVSFQKVEPKTVAHWLSRVPFVSGIGHADTARIVSGILGIEIPQNRISVTLTGRDTLIVAQYIGPRLPEGTTTLPEGARIEFYKVNVNEPLREYSGEPDWMEGSIYGALKRRAEQVAHLVGGNVEIKEDPYGNVVFEIVARGFRATLHDD
jgi:hypothetical protein